MTSYLTYLVRNRDNTNYKNIDGKIDYGKLDRPSFESMNF